MFSVLRYWACVANVMNVADRARVSMICYLWVSIVQHKFLRVAVGADEASRAGELTSR
jgi:hypothetical protein